MPTSITFFYHDEDYEKPTMTIHHDGSCEEHGLPFLRRRRCVVRLEPRMPGPTRAQIDAVEMISAYAISKNPYCVLTYKCLTSPWALEMWAKNRYLSETLGDGLPWPLKLQPVRKRMPKGVFSPKAVKAPNLTVRGAE